MSKSKEKEKSRYDRQCVFIGRRLGKNDKVHYGFELLPKREKMWFGKISRVYIGHTYECAATGISRRPKRVDRPVENNPEWEAEDALVDQANAEKRADAQIAKLARPQIRAAIEAI